MHAGTSKSNSEFERGYRSTYQLTVSLFFVFFVFFFFCIYKEVLRMRLSVGVKRRWEDSSSKADVVARKRETARERECRS